MWRYGAFGWSRVATAGFGDKYNESARSMAATDSYLYVGTDNWKAGCEVWRYDGKSWAQVNKNGFGDAEADAAAAMIVHGGKLYVGTQNYPHLAAVWRFDGPGTSNWTKVSKNGFGVAANYEASSMAGILPAIAGVDAAWKAALRSLPLPAEQRAQLYSILS